ncbi:hypothetical protein [Roseisolibacter sp. H3M3-2]|uniref:hypothetical protein n=1 Tax=Roseisolibacter sp. H3M3-2 TaxID=3031323 RepID=UPI0023DCE363|nr:hypothetical protein [Roseisolibacter sp. H3M3-2]MDF1503911.1 hypothetical protein [Roseisolibacter sp. H3M3-2]
MRALPTLLLAALLAACAGDVAAPAEPAAAPRFSRGEQGNGTIAVTHSMDGRIIPLYCGDEFREWITLSGSVVERRNFVSTGQPGTGGETIAVSHTRPLDLRGVGETTGHEYRVDDRDSYRQESFEGSGGVIRHTMRARNLVTGDAYLLQYAQRWNFDAEGNLVTHREMERADCN